MENIYKECVAFEPGHRYELKYELIDTESSHLRPLVGNTFVFKGKHPCVTCSLKVIKDEESLRSYRWIREDDKKEFYSWDKETYADILVFAHQCVEVLGEDSKQMLMYRIKNSLYKLDEAIQSNADKKTLENISEEINEKVIKLENIIYSKEIESNR